MATNSDGKDATTPLSKDDVATLSNQIATLAATGLPLGAGLRATADELPHSRLRSAIHDLADSIDRGSSLEDALASQKNRLPVHFQGIMLAGIQSGRLSEVLGQFVSFSNVGVDIRRSLWISLLYPLISIGIAFGLMAFTLTMLIGSFSAIYREFSVPLPSVTVAVLSASNVFFRIGPPILAFLGAIVFVGVMARLFLKAPVRRGLMLHVPIIGNVWRSTSLAEFCHLLAVLIESNMPLPTALMLTGSGVQNTEVERACQAMSLDIGRGTKFSESFARQTIFPKGIVRILRWAEGHPGLPDSLRMTGDILVSRAKVQARFVGTLFSIFAVLFIIFGVGTVVLALFIPMISLISALSG